MRLYIDSIFDDLETNIDDNAVALHIKQEMLSIYTIQETIMFTRIQELVSFNQGNLVFSTNEHYLSDIYTKLIEGKSFTTDNGSDQYIYYKLYAYLKAQKKFIIECSSKSYVLLLYEMSREFMKNNLYKNQSKFIKFIEIEIPVERTKKVNT